MSSSAGRNEGDGSNSSNADSSALPADFCLIESRETVKDFSSMQLAEINESIQSRRNRIFLLMEEVRRLRIQQRLKGESHTKEEDVQVEPYPSVVPFLPPLTDKTVKDYYRFYLSAVSLTVLFGGVLAPVLEVKLGLGGTSYADFIQRVHLPSQLSQVDPIVASFCGGAVGVLSALFVVEMNNAKAQAKRRCFYCEGTGYLTCGNCVGRGALVSAAGNAADACSYCSGTGKVMCTACLCTGKALATEHDPRMDPFN
ncbi:hypothetical protein WJX72_003045 [[Myrmecia] bisecta]|uniref:Uncharacterized protein n=1 Tax=[Myrmecia] bisecta TaxID=41462 RepID=A0AAW1Q293_9CHLO